MIQSQNPNRSFGFWISPKGVFGGEAIRHGGFHRSEIRRPVRFDRRLKKDAKEDMMKKPLVSLFVLGLLGFAPQVPSPVKVMATAQATESLTVDVTCDCRTWRMNRVDPAATDLGSGGDTFVVRGKIFPSGTIPAGGTPDQPSPIGPDSPGSIGDWYCRGTIIASDAEAAAGVKPVGSFTQHYLLNQFKDSLVIEQTLAEFADTGDQALVGGIGKYSGVKGDARLQIIGVNNTGCPNFRTTFTIKK
jgi:hypothetical protein